MKRVQIDEHIYDCPERFDEMPLRAILAFAKLIYGDLHNLTVVKKGKVYLKDPVRWDALRIFILREAMKVPLRRYVAFRTDTIHQLLYANKLLDFLLGEKGLTVNPIPTIRKLHGPADGFATMTIEEFSFADTYFTRWRSKHREEDLNILVAILYRKRARHTHPGSLQYRGDKRQAFNSHAIEHRLEQIKRLPMPVRLAIALWYDGCRRQCVDRYPAVFSGTNTRKARKNGWPQVMLAMSGNKFGPAEQTFKTDLHTFFTEMQRQQEEAEELQAQYDKMK